MARRVDIGDVFPTHGGRNLDLNEGIQAGDTGIVNHQGHQQGLTGITDDNGMGRQADASQRRRYSGRDSDLWKRSFMRFLLLLRISDK